MYPALCRETCSEMSIGKTNNTMGKHIVRICKSVSEMSIGKTKDTMGKHIVRIGSLQEMSIWKTNNAMENTS
jgi:hypothetical protein